MLELIWYVPQILPLALFVPAELVARIPPFVLVVTPEMVELFASVDYLEWRIMRNPSSDESHLALPDRENHGVFDKEWIHYLLRYTPHHSNSGRFLALLWSKRSVQMSRRGV